MDITDRERDILRHSLGLTRSQEMYRNGFAADGESDDYNTCCQLVHKGLMTEGSSLDRLTFFYVTELGKATVSP